MNALLELQRSMRSRLLQDGLLQDGLLQDGLLQDGLLQDGLQSGAARSQQGLAIYRHNCRSTLVNALRLSFPAVQRLVGEDFFAALATAFVQARPPRSACLNDYGADFPLFVAQFPAAQTLGYLSDVARLEWAINQALHASDVSALDVARLAVLEAASLPYVCLRRHPSVSVLSMQWPADFIWRAVLAQDDAAMAAIELQMTALWLLVERDHDGVQVRRLTATDGPFAAALLEGQPLHQALAMSESAGGQALPPDEIQACLAAHLSAGRFVDYCVPPMPTLGS